MKSRVYVDGLLMEWSEKFFDRGKSWGSPDRAAPVRAGRSRPESGKASSARHRGGTIRNAGGRLEARAVRGKLADLVRKSPEVMVKVYGGGRGMRQIRKHLRYVARADGARRFSDAAKADNASQADQAADVIVEDQDGFRIRGSEALRELADDWQNGEVLIEETSSRREAVNIVLSMPEGTDPIGVLKATRDFAAREFSNHKYAMALHTADTPHYDEDKEDPPSPNPHVHLVVRSAGKDGTRLNPRKSDLRRWREGFARALQEHGVDASATSRAHRLERGRGDRQAIRQMKEQRKPFTKPWRPKANPERIEKAKQTEKEILRRYAEVVQILIESEDPTDRVLAGALADRFGLRRPTPTAPEPGRGDRSTLREVEDSPIPRQRAGTNDLER
jgi:hypothetical protein